MTKRNSPRTAVWTTILLFAGLSFWLLGGDHQRIASGQDNDRRFTGRASSTVNDLAEPGQTYGLGTVVESQAELTFDREGFVSGNIRLVWDYQRSGMSCARRVTTITTLRGRFMDGHIIGDPDRSVHEDRTTNLDPADKRRECREEFYPPHSERTNWWGRFDNDTTISIFLSRYSADQGFAARVTAGNETKRRIETYRICDGKPKAIGDVPVYFSQTGRRGRTLVTGKDGSVSGFFADDYYQVNAGKEGEFLELDHVEEGGGEWPVKEKYDLVRIPNWTSSVIKFYLKSWVSGDDCFDKPQGPPPPIVLGDPKQTVRLVNLKGDVAYLSKPPRADFYPVTEAMKLPANTTIITGPDSQITVETPDGARVVIKEMTQVTMKQLLDPTSRVAYEIEVRMGEAEAKVPRQQVIRSDFSLQTPTATASVRGTIFSVRYAPQTLTTTVSVSEGEVLVTPRNTSAKAFNLQAGQQVEVTHNNVGTVGSKVTGGPTGGSTGAGGGNYQWVGIGNGDCGGNDIGQTIGEKLPAAAQCNPNSTGTIAVCWDGNVFANPSRGGQWCTYKSKAANPCRSGSNPGLMYECRPSSKLPPDEYTLPPVAATPVTWETAANQLAQGSQRFTVTCPPAGSITDRTWGTDLYTNDSSICTAAAHSGLITVAGGGTVTIELRPGASSYKGTSRNGVTTRDFGAWPASFIFVGQLGVRPTAFPKDDYYLPPFNGTWAAGPAWGDMVLTQNGNNVAGTYSVGPGGAIKGTASLGALRFSWTRRDGGSPGEAFLTIKPDGSIEGRWCNGKGCDPSNGSPFSGRRKQ